MTKDHIEEAFSTERALKLALEALEHIDYEDSDRDFLFPYQCTMLDKAITAIKQALNDATHLAAPVQEPVAYWIPKAEQFCIADPSGRPFAKAWEPLYTTPPAQPASEPALVVYQGEIAKSNLPKGFTGSLYMAQTTTEKSSEAQPAPSQYGSPELQAMIVARALEKEIQRLSALVRAQQITIDKLEAQRQWIRLTQQDIDIAFDDTMEGGGFDDFARAIEQRLKEKNT